ncbi:hypothetical protein [Asaia astilbis]|uniref:hypothetical protein n=1 Tax=Asaia astilbis TaxID=610244 RepID=UPI00046F4E5F|nr:hypothetical protein [Asaia astilbis]
MASWLWTTDGEKVTPGQLAQRRQIAQSLLQQGQQTPAYNWAQGAANAMNSFLGGFMQGRANKAEEAIDADSDKFVQSLISGGSQQQGGSQDDHLLSAVRAPQSPQVAEATQNAASDIIADRYYDRLKQVESGNNLTAKALTSSATGPYQFTDGTWRGVMKQHPDLGLTLDGRTDPTQADAAVRALSSDNIAYMMQHGIQNPDAGQRYLAHFAGAPTASRLINADPATPVSAVMSPGQINANPFLRGKTAGDVLGWATNKMGGVDAAQMPAPQTAPSTQQQSAPMVAPLPAQTGPSQAELLQALANPHLNQQAHTIAATLLQNQMQQQQADRASQQEQQTWLARQNYQQQQQANDPLRQAQIAEYGARADALRQKTNAPAGPGYSMLSPQQAQSMGLDPRKSYQVGPDGKIGEIGNSGVNVTLNSGPTTSEFQKKSDDAAADRLGGYVQEGNAAPAMMGQLQQLSDLSRSIGTGKGASLWQASGLMRSHLGSTLKASTRRRHLLRLSIGWRPKCAR